MQRSERDGQALPTHAAAQPELPDTAAPVVPLRTFTQFYREQYDWAVRLTFLLCGDQPQAEDLAQDAFANLQKRFDAVQNPRAYLRASLVNGARSSFRKASKRRQAEGRPIETSVLPDLQVELLDAVDRLPGRQRAVVVLRYFEGLSEREISDVLRCRPGTVKSLASRAIATLRREVEP